MTGTERARGRPPARGRSARGQTNLLALVVALALVTTAAGVATVAATGAFAGARRQPVERAAAVGVSERLVAADGPLAARANVLNASAVNATNATRLRRWFPGAAKRGLRVEVDGDTLARTDAVGGGVTVERLVRVERSDTRVVADAFADGTRVRLANRSRRVELVFTPQKRPVHTVWVDGTVALHDGDALRGRYVVRTAGARPPTLAVDGDARRPGSVHVVAHPLTAEPGVLRVTVDG